MAYSLDDSMDQMREEQEQLLHALDYADQPRSSMHEDDEEEIERLLNKYWGYNKDNNAADKWKPVLDNKVKCHR